MNSEWAIGEVRSFVALIDHCNAWTRGAYSGSWMFQEGYQAQRAQLLAQLPVACRIATAIGAPEIADALRSSTDGNLGQLDLVAPAQMLLTLVTRGAELDEMTGPEGPKLAAAEMHPWVWEEAAARWSAGFYRDAVQTAATRIFDVELPRKLGVQPTKTPADLFAAFAPDKTNGTALRFPDIEPDDSSWESIHRGAMLVGQGCVKAIRNPRTHRLDITPQVALEELATLSLLARWIDSALPVPAVN